MEASEFIGTLLHAVTVAHELHLQQKGSGAYSRHVALGALYEDLQDPVDELAECWQGLNGIIKDYPESYPMSQSDPKGFVEDLALWLEKNRSAVGNESFLQNIVDEIQAIAVRAVYKLENLG